MNGDTRSDYDCSFSASQHVKLTFSTCIINSQVGLKAPDLSSGPRKRAHIRILHLTNLLLTQNNNWNDTFYCNYFFLEKFFYLFPMKESGVFVGLPRICSIKWISKLLENTLAICGWIRRFSHCVFNDFD